MLFRSPGLFVCSKSAALLRCSGSPFPTPLAVAFLAGVALRCVADGGVQGLFCRLKGFEMGVLVSL